MYFCPKGCWIVVLSQRSDSEFFRVTIRFRLEDGQIKTATETPRRVREGSSAWTPAFFYVGTLEILSVSVKELAELNSSEFGANTSLP